MRDAQSAAAALGAVGVSKVEDVLREAINRFRDRVNAFGIPPERWVTIEMDGLSADPSGFDADLCRMLGLWCTPEILQAMGESRPSQKLAF